ncbi:MAG: AraC family transcriptional regulator [Hoeflea sp.]|nr:AraC family transcriptional regulator [Hoeflea sp.]
MSLDHLISDTYRALSELDPGSSINLIQGLNLAIVCDQASDSVDRQVYEPLFCLVLQGRKEIVIGPRRIEMRPGSALIVSHDVPVATRVVEGTQQHPYLALVTRLDIAAIQSLYVEVAHELAPASTTSCIDAGEADEALIEAMKRLLAIRKRSLEAKVLGPLIHREIVFRLLQSHHGGMLREVLRFDGYAGRIAHAVRHIQDHYRERLVVSELAALSAMSLSAFHQQFKTVTGHSPLQYQKILRILEARRLLERGNKTVTDVALDVGYQSATQFSREFSREFGHPPRLRKAAEPASLSKH